MPVADMTQHVEARTITSRAEFREAIVWSVQEALAHKTRRLIWIDPDFSDWPLSEPALIDGLQRWLALPQRQLLILALDYQSFQRCHSRFLAWRKTRAHQVELLTPAAEDLADLPTLAMDGSRFSVQLLDRLHWQGRMDVNPREAHRLNKQFDALLQRSGPGLPVTTLGL